MEVRRAIRLIQLDIPMVASKYRFILDVKSCHLILDGNPAGFSSVSLFGCLRMQRRLNFSVSSTDVEIEKQIKIKVSVAPNSHIPDRRNLNFKNGKPHFEI